ncbi:MAG: NAD-dependent DNA ligase LigA [Candidatus Hodarchaeales archaeon]
MNVTEITTLANKILYHKRKYYDGEPEISDEAYDNLEEKLRKLDPKNPVLFIIGSPEGGKVTHDIPMLSCQKAVDIDDVLKWSKDEELSVDYKIDGLSLSIEYSKGRLIQAATRGNGATGDDTTVVAMKIDSIPKTIPIQERVFVRGEIFILLSEFERINSVEQEKYSSPRNLAVGTIKQKDLSLLDRRKIEFFAFELIGFGDDKEFKEKMQIMTSWGFQTTHVGFIEKPTIESISEVFERVQQERERLDFEIDGLVLKYDKAQARDSAGSTSHHPKWMIALKFESKGKITSVTDITWQVGRTGVVTPVAELEPVDVAGAVIRRATLHNREFIETLNVALGDQVMVIRSGDVIPKITEVISKGTNDLELPKECPSCKFPLKADGVNLICTGRKCKERDIQKIRHWIKILDIKGLGPRNIEKLYDSGLVEHFTELYSPKLTESRLINLLGKNGSKIFTSIQSSRDLEFHLFLAGQGIESLGRSMAKVLTNHFDTWEDLKNASLSDLNSIGGISDTTASYMLAGINDPSLGDALLNLGVTIRYSGKAISEKGRKSTLFDFINGNDLESEKDIDEELNDEITKGTIYVTGKIPEMTKKQVKEFVSKHGYRWDSLKKSLNLLVYGDKAGTAKLNKARQYGVPIKSWDEFIQELA